jgi:phosphatidylserine/phosphatidylglycerophosphate/cardiolipin synthase-like enzyme
VKSDLSLEFRFYLVRLLIGKCIFAARQDIIVLLKPFKIPREVYMRMKLLVDSDEFWGELSGDIGSAQQSIYIQTFSFEGDKAGKSLADALLSSTAVDKKIIVDDYTKWVISDKYLYTPRNLSDD